MVGAAATAPTFAGIVRAQGLDKTYRRGREEVHALRGVALDLHPGELVALVGPSGSGKSTLLNVLCGWEHPDAGVLRWTAALADRPPDQLPWERLAIVPQALGLLGDLTMAENILLPARLTGRLRTERDRAAELMAAFGIDHLARRYPNQASLGEQQRCCAARALLLRPTLLLADEPTAHQDARWTDVLFTEFRSLLRGGAAGLIATHNPETWGYADRVFAMHDGELREGMPEQRH